MLCTRLCTRGLKLLFWILLGLPGQTESPAYNPKGPMCIIPLIRAYVKPHLHHPPMHKRTVKTESVLFCRYTNGSAQVWHKCHRERKYLMQKQKNRLTLVKICGRGVIRHAIVLYYNIICHHVLIRLCWSDCMTSHCHSYKTQINAETLQGTLQAQVTKAGGAYAKHMSPPAYGSISACHKYAL